MAPSSKRLAVCLGDPEISADIIESCRQGDRDAFRVVYEAHKDRVYSIALYFFHGDAQTASDVTQQVFLNLMRIPSVSRRLPHFRHGCTGWL